MSDEVTKELHNLQEAINCIRKQLMSYQTELTADMTEFKRDQVEKFMSFKYEHSESQAETTYQLRHELTDMLAQNKSECTTINNSRKEWITEQLSNMKELFDTKIAGKMRATLVTSGVIFLAITILSTVVFNTRTTLEKTRDSTYEDMSVFKEQIAKQLNDFKTEMRKEFGGQLTHITSNQVEMMTLLRIHLGDTTNDFHKTRSE